MTIYSLYLFLPPNLNEGEKRLFKVKVQWITHTIQCLTWCISDILLKNPASPIIRRTLCCTERAHKRTCRFLNKMGDIRFSLVTGMLIVPADSCRPTNFIHSFVLFSNNFVDHKYLLSVQWCLASNLLKSNLFLLENTQISFISNLKTTTLWKSSRN